jgi:hypothetical protein
VGRDACLGRCEIRAILFASPLVRIEDLDLIEIAGMGFRIGGSGHVVPMVSDFKPLRGCLLVVVYNLKEQ